MVIIMQTMGGDFNKKLTSETTETHITSMAHTTSMAQQTGLKRQTLDKFYTCPAVVEQCITLINQQAIVSQDDLCIEPSAGNGSFINAIKTLSRNHLFYDLKPENDDIIQQDYLTFDSNQIALKPGSKIHVIGNPPFGRQSSLAIKFIKKSCEYCDSCCFILPKSFKKESLKKHYPLHFHLVSECDLPSNSFIVDDKPYDVPCVFQIWVKMNTNRVVAEKHNPNHYKFVKNSEDHDISFRRVGVNAGCIHKDTHGKSIQSHYFIKFDIELTDELFDKLKSIEYNDKNNTCGPKSISKQELIKEFNKFL